MSGKAHKKGSFDKPKHSAVGHNKSHGEAAKGGAGGKGTWGKAGDEEAPLKLDKNDPMYDSEDESNKKLVCRLVTAREWKEASEKGSYKGGDLDARDGYIHLSTHEQAIETASLFFKDCPDLCAVVYYTDMLGSDLKWEPVAERNYELFPHFYGESLPVIGDAVEGVYELVIRNGQHSFP